MIQIEDVPVVDADAAHLAEVVAALQQMKPGQSVTVDARLASRTRQRAAALPGKFKTRTEGAKVRIGRVA